MGHIAGTLKHSNLKLGRRKSEEALALLTNPARDASRAVIQGIMLQNQLTATGKYILPEDREAQKTTLL